MRAVIQRATSGEVRVGGRVVGRLTFGEGPLGRAGDEPGAPGKARVDGESAQARQERSADGLVEGLNARQYLKRVDTDHLSPPMNKRPGAAARS